MCAEIWLLCKDLFSLLKFTCSLNWRWWSIFCDLIWWSDFHLNRLFVMWSGDHFHQTICLQKNNCQYDQINNIGMDTSVFIMRKISIILQIRTSYINNNDSIYSTLEIILRFTKNKILQKWNIVLHV